MTCRLSLALLLAFALAGCGGDRKRTDQPDDWRAMLANGDAVGAEALLHGELDRGGSKAALAPFLGEAALLRGDLEDARNWLGSGEFAPEVAGQGFHMLGRLRMGEGDLASAGQAFDRALAIAPRDAGLWVDIGRLRWRGGEHFESVAASKKALELAPSDPGALLLRAQQLRDAEGYAAALPLLERGLAAAPSNSDLLAEYAATLGDLGRARDMLTAVRRLPPGPRGYYLQAVLAARAGEYDLARSFLERSGLETPAAGLLLALIDLENGNAESAAQGFDTLLRRQPDNRRARLLLARALAIGGNHRELIARFGRQADSPYLALLVGRAHEALGEREKAAPFLDRAFQPRAPALVLLDSPTPAGVAYSRAKFNGPYSVALVRGLIAAGRADEGRRVAERFFAAHPGSADALSLAGDAALAAGDPARAVVFYRKASAIRSPWPITKKMALALDRSGGKEQANAALRQHLEREPMNDEARAWVARR